jgi:glutamine amidotransferase
MICVIDYGMGNLRSVSKALEKLGGEVIVSSRPEELARADKAVLPGVGAFGDGASELEKRGLAAALKELLQREKPFLGICLGMQLLFETSEESPGARGLGLFAGTVRRFRSEALKIPHMGWNEMKVRNPKTPLLQGVKDGSFFYFVHSYYPAPEDRSLVAGTCNYGEEFPCFMGGGSIWASQFHPEKSQAAGLQILSNFIAL